MTYLRTALPVVITMTLGVVGLACAQSACDQLRTLRLPDTELITVQEHAAGTEEFPAQGPPGVPAYPVKAQLPASCRVTGSIHPTSDSDIRFELWLPLDNWNHRYQQIGSGGLGGSIATTGLIGPLQQGWAVAATDDGHTAAMSDGRWAAGHPQKIIDYGYRAVHLTALRAQAIVQAFYRARAAHRYFVGCSDGGRESMMEAQRFPSDFDGFVAGAPAFDIPAHVVATARRLQLNQALGPDALTAAQARLVATRALQRCDALDGVTDGVIADPRRCDFKPQELVCQASRTDSCLTQAQADVVQKYYDVVTDPKTGQIIEQGFADSLGASVPIVTASDPNAQLAQQVLGIMVYGNAQLGLGDLDLSKSWTDAQTRLARDLNATSTDLRAVRGSGKKIIHYHGLADPLLSAESSRMYFESVQKRFGDTRDFYRLFLVPGMGHCGGGVGPTSLVGVTANAGSDAVYALVHWVEDGVAPDQIIGSEVAQTPASAAVSTVPPNSTRPVCSYPAVAHYRGQGSITDAANFVCGP